MRKKTVASPTRRPTALKKRALRISKETIRTLTLDDLSKAAGGCPWFTSSPGTDGESKRAACTT